MGERPKLMAMSMTVSCGAAERSISRTRSSLMSRS
jgi:hypothetical protein